MYTRKIQEFFFHILSTKKCTKLSTFKKENQVNVYMNIRCIVIQEVSDTRYINAILPNKCNKRYIAYVNY